MTVNLRQFQYVLTLAQEGSFSRAAETLEISQPSLSQYIKKIEKEIGMELFQRTNGDVRLTDAGRVYVETGKEILKLQHDMENRFTDIASHKSGSIIVGTSPYRSAAMMPQAVLALSEKYPEVRVIVEEMTSAELIEEGERGRFDLLLTVLPLDERFFSWEKIMDEELILAVPVSFPVFQAKKVSGKKYPVISVEQLDGGKFITVKRSQIMQRALKNLCLDYHISVKEAVTVKSLEAQIAMVRSGIGMALVPSGIEIFCQEKDVRFYSFSAKLPKREVVAAWRKGDKPNGVARDLMSEMKKCLQAF